MIRFDSFETTTLTAVVGIKDHYRLSPLCNKKSHDEVKINDSVCVCEQNMAPLVGRKKKRFLFDSKNSKES